MSYIMVVKTLTRMAAVFFALFVLVASLIETSSIKYAFGARDNSGPLASPQVNVTYALPHPGDILPGNPLWPAKALRDKVSLELTSNPLRKSEFELHLADKRLSAGWELWIQESSEEALGTFNKAENYLNTSYETLSRSEEKDNGDQLRSLAYSSLKHREVLEKVLASCGDEARPTVSKMLDTSKMIFDKVNAQMITLHLNPPQNPF